MKPLDRPAELQHYYRDRGVVAQYMTRRTAQPLNGVLHREQVQFLNRMIADAAPAALLEIACGPGRLTTALRGVRFGVAVDFSPAMLETAMQRLNGGGGWTFLRSDAFVLPFQAAAFDAVYTLRFVRHFQLADRQRLYQEVRRVLRPHGVFVVDALNRAASLPQRMKRGLDHYPIYDVLYERTELEAELRAAGFRVRAVAGLLRHYGVQRALNRLRRLGGGGVARALIAALERVPGRNPSTWMVLCEKEI